MSSAGRLYALSSRAGMRRRSDRVFCVVFWLVIAVMLSVVVYCAAVIAAGGLFVRSGALSHRVPSLTGPARLPVLLGPRRLHPYPYFRLPNYLPRHAS